MEDYVLGIHARRRIIQRKIDLLWIYWSIEYGDIKEEFKTTRKMSISKKKCQELINDILKKINDNEKEFKNHKKELMSEILNKKKISQKKYLEYKSIIDKMVSECNLKNKELEIQLESLIELEKRGGIIVIYNPESKKIITVFHKNEKITAEFNVY